MTILPANRGKAHKFYTEKAPVKKLPCLFCERADFTSHMQLQAHLNDKHPGWAADYIRKVLGKERK